jgi:ABC-type polysaccharide/polyol phosphate transport system ATPase subunit
MSERDDCVLRLDGVWKRHRRYRKRPQHLKEALIGALKGRRAEYDEFWALRDFSLSVRRGESVGFCGPNGAGKSTVLKVVSRILPATHGTITARGRVAALLELGAGFLPELTGRENAVLNSAILGLSDAETRERMEAMIEFADLGDFIDSPVRTYSTGMYMRLGFAIASHVEAEILLLDEVLAVGDAGFQQKCESWLKRIRESGTTVLIVSHDLDSLREMCDRVVWLENGRVREEGPPDEIVDRYESSQTESSGERVSP